jgi:hypothetical protein
MCSYDIDHYAFIAESREETDHPHNKHEAKTVHRIAATAAALPSHT